MQIPKIFFSGEHSG